MVIVDDRGCIGIVGIFSCGVEEIVIDFRRDSNPSFVFVNVGKADD